MAQKVVGETALAYFWSKIKSGLMSAAEKTKLTNTALVFEGTCGTAGDTAVKAVTCTAFKAANLVKGAKIYVLFTVSNSAAVADLKMNVNSTGEKPLRCYRNGGVNTIPGAGYLDTNQTYLFYYDGTNWVTLLDYNSNTTYSDATQSAHGLMSTDDKEKLDGIDEGANAYTHPAYTARTGQPTMNQAPDFGGTFTISQVTSDATGHVTGMTDRSIKIPNFEASETFPGLMSKDDKKKLNGIAEGATANTGTVKKVSTGAGLTGGDITGTGTVKANLTSETKLTNAAADGTETSGRVYPVRLDKNGKLAVNVPWTNVNDDYLTSSSSLNAGKLSSGTVPAARLPAASNTAKGAVIVSDTMGLTMNEGFIKVNVSSDSTPSGQDVETYLDSSGKLKGAVPFAGDSVAGVAAKMSGASSSADGALGMVPQPKAGDQGKFLRGDGTWAADNNSTTHVYVNATSGGAASNAATANTTTYIHLYDGSTKRDTIQLKGAGGASVAATNGKVITITGETNTDTSCTAVGNHYAPSADSSAELTAAIDGEAGAYAKNTTYTVLTGVKAQRDAKGHVTGLTYTAQQIKDTNDNTKVTSVGNHYAPTEDEDAELTAAIDGSAGAYAKDTEYTVLTGVKAQRDAKGHVTGLTYTAQKVKDTNTTYESKAASSGGTAVSLVTTGEKYTWNQKTSNAGTVTKVSTGAGLTGGDITGSGTVKADLTSETKLTNAAADGTETSGRVYPVRLDKNGKLAVNVPWTNVNSDYLTAVTASNHYTPTAASGSELTAAIDGSAGAYAKDTEYTVLTGVKAQRDAKGHVTGLTYTAQKVKDTNTTYESKAAASGGTAVSLVTTGEKYTWNQKTSNTGTVTKVSTGAGLTGGDITGSGTVKADLTSETKLTNAAADGTETSGRVYPVRLDKNGKLAVNVPWTNVNGDYLTAVTATNHYTPTAASGSELTAAISGSAGSYALGTEYTVLTGVKAQRDAKGHVTGLTYTAQKIKDTNDNTKVTSAGNHYAPAADANAELTAEIDGEAGAYAKDTVYTVLTGVKAQRDAKGHVTGLTYTAQQIKDTNNTYTTGNNMIGANGSNYIAHSTVYRYQLLFQVDENKFTPLNNVSNGASNTSKTILTSVEFDPFGQIFAYYSTTTVSKNAAIRGDYLFYTQTSFNTAYSLNVSADVNPMTAAHDVYLKVSPQSSGKVKLASATPIVQTLPTSNDGYWYIYLGRAVSATNLSLHRDHPVYYHNGSQLCQKFPPEQEASVIALGGTALAVNCGTISNLPTTISNSAIKSSMVALNAVFSNPHAQIGNWTITTANGSVTISGKIRLTTDLTLYLG